MKIQIKSLLLTFLSFLFLLSSVDAQLISTNNLGNFPPTGPFDVNGKFMSMGESGGIPGPVNSCDFYGLRAQTDSLTAINVGLTRLSPVTDIPTISFSRFPMFILQQDANGPGTAGNLGGCGKALALFFDGTGVGGNSVFQVYGSATAFGGNWVVSDLSLKRNIQTIPSALDLVNSLEGVTYEYEVEKYAELNLTEGMQYGFIADEVKKVMPEAVRPAMTKEGEAADFDVMNYDMIIPVLAEAIKEQQATIKKLEERIARMETIKGTNNGALNPSTKVGLDQNRPNPFSGVTTISYDLPQDVSNAKLVVYDTKGAVVTIFDLERGQGEVAFDASAVGSGVYFYAIEVNGENLARKKMIVK